MTIRYRLITALSFLLFLGTYAASATATSNVTLGSAQGLDVVVDTQTGAAIIFVDQKPWMSLTAGLEVKGWGPLSLVSSKVTPHNNDPLFGEYTRCHFLWQGMDDAKHVLETSFLVYKEHSMVVFEQVFPAGWTNPNPSDPHQERTDIVVGFPSIHPHLLASDMGYLVWGSCFVSDALHGDWTGETKECQHMFSGHEYGQPWLLHNDHARSVVMSSLDNFFVSGFGYHDQTDTIQAGLRSTLESIPQHHRHTSVLVAGQGINATLMDWGDVLLTQGGAGKKRSKVYDDFVLAHAGYFTDNGAYHYHGVHQPEYANMEEALLGVKNGFQSKSIPIRYVQWDDWWMESKGDLPGMLSWTPKPDVFPSGFTNWLDMPLALYAPGYSAENVWMDDYTWKTGQTHGEPTSIPLDPKFYMDLFRNGTQIGMKLFEQDFLCFYGIGGSGLTSTDVDSGVDWFTNMDQAAQAFDITLQLCMPNGYHLLQSTTLKSVTNARATYDNTRDYPSVAPMGSNSLLFHALGIFASRDNIWTSSSTVEQKGCGNGKFCYEPNAHLDNAVTVLSNGPYGIADSVQFVNKTIVMYACRTDGFMLRPRWPLGGMDFTYTDPDAKGTEIWAAHDDFGPYRWSYILGVGLANAVAITPKRLVQGAFELPSSQQQMVAWKVVPGEEVTELHVFSEESPFMLPESEPLNLPYDVKTPPHTHYATAPVLSNGQVLLGEVDKWTTMSFGRILSLDVDPSGISKIEIAGAPGEQVSFAYLNSVGDRTIQKAVHTFPDTCSDVDQHGNPICKALLVCGPGNEGAQTSEDAASVW